MQFVTALVCGSPIGSRVSKDHICHIDTLKDALHYSAGITFAATENGTDQLS